MSKKGGFLLGAILGATAAAATTLLLAPKSGKELRSDLSDQADKAKGTAKDYSQIAKEKGTEMRDVAMSATEDIKISLKDTANKMKSQMSSNSQGLKDNLDDIKSEVKDAAEQVKEKGTEVKEEFQSEQEKKVSE